MSEYDAAFLFLEPGTDPAVDRVVVEQPGARNAFVWVPDASSAASAAVELIGRGVRLLELYRGFDVATAAEVIRAVDGRAPVGVALRVGAAAAGLPEQRPRHTATIYADEDADPAVARTARTHDGGGSTTVVGVPDADAPQIAESLVAAGAELIELCGATPLTTAARVAATVGDRVPVGLVTWSFESIDGVAAYKAAFAERITNPA